MKNVGVQALPHKGVHIKVKINFRLFRNGLNSYWHTLFGKVTRHTDDSLFKTADTISYEIFKMRFLFSGYNFIIRLYETTWKKRTNFNRHAVLHYCAWGPQNLKTWLNHAFLIFTKRNWNRHRRTLVVRNHTNVFFTRQWNTRVANCFVKSIREDRWNTTHATQRTKVEIDGRQPSRFLVSLVGIFFGYNEGYNE